ncbi:MULTISPECIES: hypothetical protein [Stenotrophomonas]|uniref:hypothetical protein n=1 Tax=Stenotrophomonas TaxID=40323 RepID=UPI00166139E7|nr:MULTISPECIES: hypothetical protein [Stenotrophomonas]MBN5058836.1 hypothetical protein [Stenotrophomonas maltophilia]MBN5067182.1 hypothetical protein [Stenotrophomonas maltophilia]MCW8342864.1 hypothetical protein [Stenotrophomonas sp. SG1]UGB19426.1 hypothetical protein LQ332_09650 [Stenotrophomonas maltophilia]UGB50347.1 hypothetical protein LQ330_04550 [Stenotrophomonas maltophilia]
MGSHNGHAPPHRNPPPAHDDPHGHLISAEDVTRLWRISYAVELIAVLPVEAAKLLGITADHTSAVAEYIRDDLREILTRSKPADE